MMFLSDILIDGYTGDVIGIIKDDSDNAKRIKNQKVKKIIKSKKENKKVFSKLANKTAGCAKISPIEIEMIKSVVRTGQSRHLHIPDKQSKNYQKTISINNTKSFRRNG